MLVTVIKAVSLSYLIGAIALTISAVAWLLLRSLLAPERRSAAGLLLMISTAVLAFCCSVYIYWGVVTFQILMTTTKFHLLMTGGWAAVITGVGLTVFLASMVIAFIGYLRGRLPQSDSTMEQLPTGQKIRFVDDVSTACVIGVIRPEIWVNPAYWDSLDDDQRRLALIHEQAHIQRRDNLAKLILGFFGALYSALPWIRSWVRGYELDSELAVDTHCRLHADESAYIELVSGAVAYTLAGNIQSATSSLNQSDLRLRLSELKSSTVASGGVAGINTVVMLIALSSISPIVSMLLNPDLRCMLACYLGY